MVADSGWVRGINTPSLRVIKKKKKKKKNLESLGFEPPLNFEPY